jgi:O-antigen/teichoic acid export membrane protein
VDYGVVSLTSSVRSLLLMLMPMSTTGAVTYWFNLRRSQEREMRRELGNIAGLTLALAFGWLLVAMALGPLLQRRFLPDMPLAFWPYGAMVVVSAWSLSFQTVPMALLAAQERQQWTAIINVALGLAQFALVILMVVRWRGGAAGQVRAMFVYAMSAGLFFLWLIFHYTPPRIDFRFWREVVWYSFPLLPHQLSVWALNLSDRLIIGHYGKPFAHDLGLYSLGYAVAMLMQAVVSAFSSIWSTVYMHEAHSNPHAQTALGRVAALTCLALAFATAGLILFAPALVALIGGARYAGSSRYVAPVALAYFLQGTYLFPVTALFYQKKTRWVPMITIPSCALNIGLNLALIPHYGVIVAAWSTTAGFGLMAILGFAIGHPVYPLAYPWKPLLAATAVLAGAFLLNQLSSLSFGVLGLKALAWLAAAGLAWLLFGREAECSLA